MVDSIALSVTPGAKLENRTNGVPVLVSVQPPAGTVRTPSDICCVIDVSWSMSMLATVAGGESGLSLMDVAKHAVNTVINTLGPEDRFALATFCGEAKLILPLRKMDEDGKKLAAEKCEAITFGSATNLWAGLKLGLDTLAPDGGERFSHMILLTDGDTQFKEAVMPGLQGYKSKGGRLPCTVNCFGFGYEIDSVMLLEVANFCDGSYAFIPDAGFVGTVFVNSMSNLLVTMGVDSCLKLTEGNGAEIVGVVGQSGEVIAGSATLQLGALQHGQSKDIVVIMNIPAEPSSPYLHASLEFRMVQDRKSMTVKAEGVGHGEAKDFARVVHHLNRSKFVEACQVAIEQAKSGSFEAAQATMSNLARVVGESASVEEASTKALLEDIAGQASEAVSKEEYFTKWGLHYLASIMLAHRMQQCNNFKDPGVQVYGGAVFNDVRDLADDVFNTLSPPKITPAAYRYKGKGVLLRATPAFSSMPSSAARIAPSSMAAFNDRYAGCIDGSSRARLASGELRRVDDLTKGDHLTGAGGVVGEVHCVAKCPCNGGRALFVELPGGARVTPFHPVFIEGAWRFPVEVADPEETCCEAVYSVLLHGASELVVEGTPCVALGHGIDDGAAKHPYFGTKSKVIADLSRFPGFEAGLVELPQEAFLRDSETGLVKSIRAPLPYAAAKLSLPAGVPDS
mmetsp:Transcript_91680/g.258852  ORF Transcript_91680/g.258852 Transcript_91680/m.258852 type:complete len:681 (-) Transcript_91680:215-2257(-)